MSPRSAHLIPPPDLLHTCRTLQAPTIPTTPMPLRSRPRPGRPCSMPFQVGQAQLGRSRSRPVLCRLGMAWQVGPHTLPTTHLAPMRACHRCRGGPLFWALVFLGRRECTRGALLHLCAAAAARQVCGQWSNGTKFGANGGTHCCADSIGCRFGSLYGELARFVLRLLGFKPRDKKTAGAASVALQEQQQQPPVSALGRPAAKPHGLPGLPAAMPSSSRATAAALGGASGQWESLWSK